MFIKIFGMVFATGKDKELFLSPPVLENPVGEQKEQVSSLVLPQPFDNGSRTFQELNNRKDKTRELFLKTIDIFNDLHPITRAIQWPNPGDDSFKRTITRKEILEFDRCAKRGFFDICSIRELVEKLNIIKTDTGGVAYKKLQSIHCAHWENIEKDFLKIIPALVSEVFAGFEFPEENSWEPNNYKF